MSKLNSALSFLKLCFSNTSEVLKNLYNFTEETASKNIVVKKHKLKDGLPTVDLLDILPGFNETVEDYTFLEGTSYITDLALLKGLAKKHENAQYFEFGTWRGESIVNVARVAGNCISLSFSEAEMKAVGMPDSAVKTSRIFSKGRERIVHIEHNTQTFDFTPYEKKFDLIFVDADHQYPGVKIDTQNAFKLLKDEKSMIVWHDVGRGTENNNWTVIAGILDGAPSEEHRKKIYRVSNTICAVYTQEHLKSGFPEKYVPNKSFTINISAARM